MDINKKGWVGAKLMMPGATVSGLPSKKGKGKKNKVTMMGGKRILGKEMPGKNKLPGNQID